MKSLYGQTVGTKQGEKKRIYDQDVAQVDMGVLYQRQRCKQIRYHGKTLMREHRPRSYVKVLTTRTLPFCPREARCFV